MILITKAQRECLLAQGKQADLDGDGSHFPPVVKLFLPGSGATWLLSEISPHDHDTAFGLCDLGMGEPELGYVSLTELSQLRSRMGLKVERDLHFRGGMSIVEYAREARLLGYIRA
jgi:hypothetical protein